QFYSEAILSRRGPLGKVWLAAHMERKLSKAQTIQTDIQESVDVIMGQDVEVLALRLSGQLLLGVVKIYSRKAKYLLDDCNEALLKIKMAFRPGIVDMPEGDLVVNKNTITLQGVALDLDAFMPDIDWCNDFQDLPLNPQGTHQARIDDITLQTDEDFLNSGDALNLDIGPSDGIGSQDFGLDWDLMSETAHPDDSSVGVGRDASVARQSIDSRFGLGQDDMLSVRAPSRERSEHPFGADLDVEMPDYGAVDLGELGITFDDSSRACEFDTALPTWTLSYSIPASPLSELPPTPPAEPAPDITVVQGDTAGEEPPAKKRKTKEKKQIIDTVIELDGRPGAGQAARDVSGILTEQRFLPRSVTVMRMLAIRQDPLSHFAPTMVGPEGSFFYGGPPGLPPQLAELFMVPVNTSTGKRHRASPQSPNKRPRLEETTEEMDKEQQLEAGRRDSSVVPSVVAGGDVLGRRSAPPEAGLDFGDQTMAFEDFQLGAGDDHVQFEPMDVDIVRQPSEPLSELTRTPTPGVGEPMFEEEDMSYADASCPIAAFDDRSDSQRSSESQRQPVGEGKGYSRNTVKALGIVRRELRPVEGEEVEDRVMSFNKMAIKASRRAAASFFFELLVLATRDSITVSQSAPFENIEVRARDKLWERHMLSGSTAPSDFGDDPFSRGPSAAPPHIPSHRPSRAPPSAVPSRGPSIAPSRGPSIAPLRGASVARSLGSALGL
ncbi:hypothetical protein FISHEDRAFT_51390, partial [Fistulina hepatica ATCC 64428]